MNTYFLKNFQGITSASIEKYLLFTGWFRDESFKNNRMWIFRNHADKDFSIAVPASENLTDFYSRLYDLIHTLSMYNERPEQEIIDSLKSAYTDRIRFRIVTETSKDGRIPLEYAAQCLEGLKDLVLYAACAEENARPICARTYNNAKSITKKFQFGQTEIGSFIFNIDVQVASEENEQHYLIDAAPTIPEPKEHKIIKRIETAIQQVNSVANRQMKVNELVEHAYKDGLTANMCDAITKLRPDDIEDIMLETSIYYAEAITHSVTSPKVSLFDNVHFALVDEISKRYKDCTMIEDVALNGTIRMLSKGTSGSNDETENTVRLLTKVENQIRAVNLHLSPENHMLACNAYRDDKEVNVIGTLDKSNKFWFFNEVTSFTVID